MNLFIFNYFIYFLYEFYPTQCTNRCFQRPQTKKWLIALINHYRKLWMVLGMSAFGIIGYWYIFDCGTIVVCTIFHRYSFFEY